MSTVNDTDLLLVERNGTQYQITFDEMSTLNDDDLLLVERGGVQYKLAAVDLDLSSGSMGSPVEVLTPLDGAGVGGAFNYTAVSDVVTSKGDPFRVRGVTYSTTLGEDPEEIQTMAYGNGRYVVTTDGSASNSQMVARYSDDGGLTWTQAPFPSMQSVYKMIHNGTHFVAVGSGDHTIVYSADGITWSVSSGDIGYTYSDLAFDPSSGRIVAVGNYLSYHQTRSTSFDYADGRSSVIYSDDNGATWVRPNLTSGSNGTVNIRYHNHTSIAYGNGLWVVGPSYEADSMYSNDGVNWYSSGNDSYGNYAQSNLIYNDEAGYFMFIAISGSNRHTVTTYNGINWSSGYVFTNSNQVSGDMRIDNIAYGDGNIISGFSKQNNDDWYFAVLNDEGNWNTAAFYWYRPHSTYYYPAPRKVFYLNNQFIMLTQNRGSEEQLMFFGEDNRPWQGTSHYQTVYAPSDIELAEVTVASENIFKDSDGSVVPGVTFDEVFSSGGTEIIDTFGGVAANGYSIYSYGDYQVSGTTSYVNANYLYYSNLDVGERLRRTSESTVYGPSATDVEFTSENAGTTPVNATDATLAFRRWTLETRATSSDPWTLVTESDDYSPVASQDGATPWASKPTLSANTMYRVKVAYHSANARTVESNYVEFTTGDS